MQPISTNALAVIVFVIGIVLTALNIYGLYKTQQEKYTVNYTQNGIHTDYYHKNAVLWVHGKTINTRHLRHVIAVFERLGYVRRKNDSDWDVIWSHEYPFQELRNELMKLKPHQKVNHFPGSGYITNKVSLATSGSFHIPRAFKIPEDKNKLQEFAKLNPEMLFVQKSNDHRGVKLQKMNSLDLKNSGSFVQEYISNPLLVDGHKFDIGIYTILTSIEPLRVYTYAGDVLFRFCPEKYHPFDPNVLDKYVVGDDYLPIWNVPSLKYYYSKLGFSMKDSFDAYLQANGKDARMIWDQVNEAIGKIYLLKEPLLINSASHYKYKHNFFEMVRFDFVVDEDLNVFIMEANMSPNLSSAHYPPNQLLYEQVIYNLLSLVGVGNRIHEDLFRESSPAVDEMQVSFKHLAVEAAECAKEICHSCLAPECLICKPCLIPDTIETLKSAYLEHQNRLSTRRVFPPPMSGKGESSYVNVENLSPENQLMYRWFKGKCIMDTAWCT